VRTTGCTGSRLRGRPPPPADAAPLDAAATARHDVHTDPAGATVAIYRCGDAGLENCSRGRSPGKAIELTLPPR